MNIVGLVLSVPRRSSALALRVASAAAGLLDAAEQVPILLVRVTEILTVLEGLLLRAGEITAAAGAVVARVDDVRVDAARVVAQVDALQQRAARLVTAIEPLVAVIAQVDPVLIASTVQIVEGLQPLLRSTTQLKPDLPDEAAELVHRSLPIVEELAVTLMPLLQQLQGSIPDVRQILTVVTRLEPVMTDVETRIAGLPGAGLLLKRGEREIEAAKADD